MRTCIAIMTAFQPLKDGQKHEPGVVYLKYVDSGPALEVMVGQPYRRLLTTLYIGVSDHRTAMLTHCARMRVHGFMYMYFEIKKGRDNVSGEQAARRLGREWRCADLVEEGVQALDDAMTSVTGP